ncbi:hypothetical protein LSH36_75g06032 [Paralvinella palmiformis]|uniref:EF-hand domain-containing protein n=1 Tax=Paralvinella palmiformis TaxID=53620 RepID=A0AAD9K4A4_9ANNE|nr:hypothetical protein LSH36_75g06032 [Paralvinella palmiformis]
MGNKGPKLAQEDLEDLRAKTNFSPKQIRKWYKGFMSNIKDDSSRAYTISQLVYPQHHQLDIVALRYKDIVLIRHSLFLPVLGRRIPAAPYPERPFSAARETKHFVDSMLARLARSDWPKMAPESPQKTITPDSRGQRTLDHSDHLVIGLLLQEKDVRHLLATNERPSFAARTSLASGELASNWPKSGRVPQSPDWRDQGVQNRLMPDFFCQLRTIGLPKDCPSGQLTRSQFVSIYQEMFPEGQAKAFYEHVFRTFDEDDSGKIDFKEFLQFFSSGTCGLDGYSPVKHPTNIAMNTIRTLKLEPLVTQGSNHCAIKYARYILGGHRERKR